MRTLSLTRTDVERIMVLTGKFKSKEEIDEIYGDCNTTDFFEELAAWISDEILKGYVESDFIPDGNIVDKANMNRYLKALLYIKGEMTTKDFVMWYLFNDMYAYEQAKEKYIKSLNE